MYLATCEQMPELLPLAGLCCPSDREIYINVAESRAFQDETTLHEVKHASFGDVKFFSHKDEERAIRAMTPRLWPILKQFGTRWPARPHGYAALKRSTRTE